MPFVQQQSSLLDAASGAIDSLLPAQQPGAFRVDVFEDARTGLAALSAIEGQLTSTGFQTSAWLSAVYDELAPRYAAKARIAFVRDAARGAVAFVMPLLVQSRRGLRVAKFADLGVSDYCAPILGPAAPVEAKEMRRAWRAVRYALSDIDLFEFRRMPTHIGGRQNPFVFLSGVGASRDVGFAFSIDGTIADHIGSLASMFRRDTLRRHRGWRKEPLANFVRGETDAQIGALCDVLDCQQKARLAAPGGAYKLDQPGFREFYERVARQSARNGQAHLFALEAGGEIVAAVFGIEHDGVFTVLRPSTAGDAWAHISPGRLVIIEALRHCREQRGVRRFDMGIGDYDYRRKLGADACPLYDLVEANTAIGVPAAQLARSKTLLRHNKHAKTAYGWAKSAVAWLNLRVTGSAHTLTFAAMAVPL